MEVFVRQFRQALFWGVGDVLSSPLFLSVQSQSFSPTFQSHCWRSSLLNRDLTSSLAPLKNGASCTISIASETLALLRRHKAHQAEPKLANRIHYHDHGLVFAKE
jgi:hypothetical protein